MTLTAVFPCVDITDFTNVYGNKNCKLTMRGCMNKVELIDRVALDSDIPKTVAAKALEAVLNGIGDALSAGDTVALIGFGNFVVKERAARKGRNPKTGETIEIKAAKAI